MYIMYEFVQYGTHPDTQKGNEHENFCNHITLSELNMMPINIIIIIIIMFSET